MHAFLYDDKPLGFMILTVNKNEINFTKIINTNDKHKSDVINLL
jgi:hypothetical protein